MLTRYEQCVIVGCETIKIVMDKSTNNICCANCGKGEEESIGLKKCGACMSIRYCSAACQQAHRSQHKKECRNRAAELHDEALFKQPPKDDDCPICFLTLPLICTGKRHTCMLWKNYLQWMYSCSQRNG